MLHRAFSIVELLVVISIIGILVAITFPTINAMRRSGTLAAGTNTISVAADGARLAATRPITFLKDDFAPAGDRVTGEYSGAAVIITPGDEIRFIENYEEARNGAGSYLEVNNQGGVGTPWYYNGFIDMTDRDYITIPFNVGYAGIARPNAATGDGFIPPPFALRFDAQGRLIPGLTGSGSVVYDANNNGQFTTSTARTGTYDPDNWDWRRNSSMSKGGSSSNIEGYDRYELPFERIECVVGVIVFEEQEFRAAGGWGMTQAELKTWFDSNGTPVLFNRYSGTVTRESSQ